MTTTTGKSLYFDRCKDTKSLFKMLRELYLQDSRRRHPNFPDRGRITPAYTDKTANGLTRCIIDFLNLSGHQAERISCTGRLIDKCKTFTDSLGNLRTIGSTQFIPTSGTKGTADISATINGKSVKIEVKTGNDRQSVYQKQYQQQIEAAGGIYFVAKSFQQCYQWDVKTFGEAGNGI